MTFPLELTKNIIEKLSKVQFKSTVACSAADYWVLNPLSSWDEALGNFQCCLISFIIERSFVLNGIASIVRNKKS